MPFHLQLLFENQRLDLPASIRSNVGSTLIASFMGEEEALTWDPSILRLGNGQVGAVAHVSCF